VFWLATLSRRMSAICVGICRWISLVAASADPVGHTSQLFKCIINIKQLSKFMTVVTVDELSETLVQLQKYQLSGNAILRSRHIKSFTESQ